MVIKKSNPTKQTGVQENFIRETTQYYQEQREKTGYNYYKITSPEKKELHVVKKIIIAMFSGMFIIFMLSCVYIIYFT